MTLRRIGLFALVGVGGAFAFGVLATTVLDIVSPRERVAAVPVQAPPAPVAPAQAEAPAQPATPATMTLASVDSRPVRLDPAPAKASAETVIGSTAVRPVKVRTIPMVLTNIEPAITPPASALPYAATTPAPAVAAAPKPRPAIREAAAHPAHKAPAKPRHNPDDDNLVLSDGQIDRMRTALVLTPDQEGYWPAIAAELRAIGKQQPKRSATKGAAPKLQVDDDAIQRLYSAATPLIMRLREDQKRTVRQFAQMMGLQEVAAAL